MAERQLPTREPSLFDPEFLGQLEQLRLHFRIRASGQSGGGRPSRQQGASAEFSDFREYQPGDDFRRVDWNAYARFGKLILKLFMEERQMHVRMLLDQSGSMALQGKGLLAKRLALTMGYLALSSYDQLSLLPLDPNTQGLGPLTGKSLFLQAAQYLETLPHFEATRLTQSITRIPFRGSGICYLFTDGFSQDGIENALAYLRYHKQQTTLVHILSPEELDPGLEGEIRLIDSETKEERTLEMSPGVLQRYQETLQSFCGDLKERCHRYGFSYTLIPGNMDLRQAVLEQLIR